MYTRLRPWLFRLSPESAHAYTLTLLRLAGALHPVRAVLQRLFSAAPQPVRVFGLEFSNPIGLAAGYDKDGLAWRGLACLGFGHIEIGTVTPRPQPGNPRPRLFRVPQQQALINRMGFPGKGADFVAKRLTGSRPSNLILGVNLGKNADTPLENAASDYSLLLRRFTPQADYLAINVSSPNTIGLRRLQARENLEKLLNELDRERRFQEALLRKRPPLLVKLAPDLNQAELEDALAAIMGAGMDGVIAANTTLDRTGMPTWTTQEAGGISGVPLREQSTAMIASISRMTQGKLPIIGVGGVFSATDMRAKLDAGASLVQVYTGLVYLGPGLVRLILSGE